jgi:HK97 family phage prohead protease
VAQIEYRNAAVGNVDFEDRIIEVIATPYGEEIEVEYQGKMMREVFEPGSFVDINPAATQISVNRDHSYERTIGKITDLTDDPRGAIGLAKISNTPLGDETLRLAADGILRASVGAVVNRSGMEIRNGLRRIFRVAVLDHIALLPNAAYKGATVLAVRSSDVSQDVPMPNLESVLSIDGMSDLIRGRSAAPWRGKEYHNG